MTPPYSDWRENANCKDRGFDDFFPESGPSGGEAAKAICAPCGVRSECLEYAITTKQEHGIWGGLNPRERGVRGDLRYVTIVCGGCGLEFHWAATRGYTPPKHCGASCRRRGRSRGMVEVNERRAG